MMTQRHARAGGESQAADPRPEMRRHIEYFGTLPGHPMNDGLAEIERLRAALRAIREQGYVLGLGAAGWPVKEAEEALPLPAPPEVTP